MRDKKGECDPKTQRTQSASGRKLECLGEIRLKIEGTMGNVTEGFAGKARTGSCAERLR